jgi:hypothetical protein
MRPLKIAMDHTPAAIHQGAFSLFFPKNPNCRNPPTDFHTGVTVCTLDLPRSTPGSNIRYLIKRKLSTTESKPISVQNFKQFKQDETSVRVLTVLHRYYLCWNQKVSPNVLREAYYAFCRTRLTMNLIDWNRASLEVIPRSKCAANGFM